MRAPSVGTFAVRALLWLPPSFGLWYVLAPWQASIAGAFAHLWLTLLAPGLVATVERTGTTLAFVTTLRVPPVAGQEGVLVPECGALIYTYGVALLVALMMAARARWWKILAGAGLLLPFQGWGLALDLLAQVGITLGPGIAAQAGLANWHREAIALGYQVGSVILPSLMPVMTWAILCRSFIEGLVPRTGGLARPTPGGHTDPCPRPRSR
jgi:hypothetical protein